MADTVVTTILTVLSGLIAGGITSCLSPFVKWGIEKRRARFERRSQLITNWRLLIGHAGEAWRVRMSGGVGGERPRAFLAHSHLFDAMRPHLRADVRRSILSPSRKEIAAERDREDAEKPMVPPILERLKAEVARIEKEWGVV